MTARAFYRRTRFLRQASRDPQRGGQSVQSGQMLQRSEPRCSEIDEMQQSYFALFNLEPRFALATEQLDLAYRALVARIHPDRFVHADPQEQRRAMLLATQANEAYRTLKKPLLRARHLLGVRGLDVEQRGAGAPQRFLIEQMEWREALIDAQAARDWNTLQKLAQSVGERIAALHRQLEQQLDALNDGAAAAQSLQQLMFVEKLLSDIDDARARLEG